MNLRYRIPIAGTLFLTILLSLTWIPERAHAQDKLVGIHSAEIKAPEPGLMLRAEGIRAILDEVSTVNPRAKKVKPQELIDRRCLDELEQSGFLGRLWAG